MIDWLIEYTIWRIEFLKEYWYIYVGAMVCSAIYLIYYNIKIKRRFK